MQTINVDREKFRLAGMIISDLKFESIGNLHGRMCDTEHCKHVIFCQLHLDMNHRPYFHLRKILDQTSYDARWPAGIRLEMFDADKHAVGAHGLLASAFAQGGGSVPPLESWWAALRGNPEFDPALLFIAMDGEEQIAGIAQCWTSAYIKDLAVASEWRRRGLGEALLLHAFECFRQRGAPHVELKVEIDNPSGALRLYQRMGMEALV
ncbi:GNAT family N-acetyltransferase [Collimonas fungivorans]|uniref:GNAT family N-acetyltransferase n=1 Tax=Collimonas fungivorans TaxID=158899 RepID=UPI0026F06103|nr:GNAT family N-acetyltransferase [Collimonas fungivorans]